MFSHPHVLRGVKCYMYKCAVIPALLYGSETWATRSDHLQMLEKFHNQCMRKIIGVRLSDRVSNVKLRKRCGVPEIKQLVSRNRLRWLGHVHRMSDDRDPKKILYSRLEPGGASKQGGHIRGWPECVRNDLQSIGESYSWKKTALNRAKWRNTINAPVALYME